MYIYIDSCLIYVGANNLVNTTSFFRLAVLNFPGWSIGISLTRDVERKHFDTPRPPNPRWLSLAWKRLREHFWAKMKPVSDITLPKKIQKCAWCVQSSLVMSLSSPLKWIPQNHLQIEPIWMNPTRAGCSSIPGIATLKCPSLGIVPLIAAVSRCVQAFLACFMAYRVQTCC